MLRLHSQIYAIKDTNKKESEVEHKTLLNVACCVAECPGWGRGLLWDVFGRGVPLGFRDTYSIPDHVQLHCVALF